jgi:transcriptional regulator with XRE-family HTH domain
MPISIPSSTLDKFVTFGDLLRFLRRRVGLTQMELADTVGYSHTQISRLEQNLRLPDIPVIQTNFIYALGVEEESRVVERLLELAANVRREDSPTPGLCPYKGLNFYDESDAELFVGRETLTARLVERIFSLTPNGERAKERFLAVVGASGSGKSSLVRAGVVPAIRWNKTSVG